MSLLEVRDLNVWYAIDGGHSHAVRGIDITLNPGDRVGLVGESGCGKTTALMAMMGLLPPGSYVDGQLLLDGENLLAGGEATLRPHRWTDLALVFQGAMNAFNPVRRIEDQIVEPMLLHRVGAASEARGPANCWSWSGFRLPPGVAFRTSCLGGCGSGRCWRWPSVADRGY
jgi:ABC-type glutathione transport system ATPase component